MLSFLFAAVIYMKGIKIDPLPGLHANLQIGILRRRPIIEIDLSIPKEHSFKSMNSCKGWANIMNEAHKVLKGESILQSKSPISTKSTMPIYQNSLYSSVESWELNDTIGLLVFYNNTFLLDYSNVPYTLQSTGIFIPSFWMPTDFIEFDMISYYPYNSSNNILYKDTSKQNLSTQREMDIMFATKVNVSLPIYGDIQYEEFFFMHKMSHFYLTVHQNTKRNYSNISIFFNGLKHNGTFNILNGTANINNDSLPLNNWNITNLCNMNNSETIECKMILFPQMLNNDIEVSILSDEFMYNDTIQHEELESGYSYFYEFYANISTITFTHSDSYTKSNPFSQSNEFTNSNTFYRNLTCSNTLTYSYIITQTYIVNNSFITNTYSLTFLNSTNVYTNINYIYYEYTIVQYTFYYSYYSLYYFNINSNNNDNNKTNNIVIIIVCVIVILILIIISLLIIFLIRHQKSKENSKYTESSNIEEIESMGHISSCHKLSHIEEDPFAKDFNEDNIIESI